MDGDASQLDEDLRRRHGITECKVCLPPLSQFLLRRYGADIPPAGRQPNGNTFSVHFGRCFLKLIAKYAFDETHSFANINWNELYREYIRSEHSALSISQFREIIREYFVVHERNFLMRIRKIIAKKKSALKEKRKGAWISEGGYEFRVPFEAVKGAEKALKDIKKCGVNLIDFRKREPCKKCKRCCPTIDDMGSGDEPVVHDFQDNARAVTEELLEELINRTSESITIDDGPDGSLQRSSAVLSLEQQDGEFDSDATEDAYMEEDLADKTSVASDHDFMYSCDTCNGDDFGRNSSAHDSDSTVPIENGIDNHDSDTATMSDEGEENSCIIKNAVRNTNQAIVLVPMKL